MVVVVVVSVGVVVLVVAVVGVVVSVGVGVVVVVVVIIVVVFVLHLQFRSGAVNLENGGKFGIKLFEMERPNRLTILKDLTDSHFFSGTLTAEKRR